MRSLPLVLLSLVLSASAEERSVDVLVVGGTTKGVEAACRARAEGRSVFLATAHPSLGEDRAGTLELGFDVGAKPRTDLDRKLWQSKDGLAAYDYFPDRQSDGIRWIYHNDRWSRLAEPGRPQMMDDVVLYVDDVGIRCVLRKPAKVSKVSVLTMEADTYLGRSLMRERDYVRLDETKRGITRVATRSVGMKFLSGPRRGESLELENRGAQFDVPPGIGYPGGRAVLFEKEVGEELAEVQLTLHVDPAAHHQLLSRIWFHLAEAGEELTPPTPLKVRRTYDAELLAAGVDFLTSTPVRRVLRDGKGAVAGVEFVNRSGRLTVRAKDVVDATTYGTLGRLPAVAAEEKFSRIVISGERPSAPGMQVEELPTAFANAHAQVTGKMYRCTFSLPMKDGGYPSFAAAEWAARELTKTKQIEDQADVLVWHPSPKAQTCAALLPDELPVWGEFDVVVVGGGTAGAPAGLAAARSGAKTLIVEYRDMLGGVGSDGMVTGFFDGNHCGFTSEFTAAYKKNWMPNHYCRAETWRQLCNEAGATVWLGAMGLGVVREGNKVVGVEVSTPFGTGIVRAKCVIDGTGNADVAAAAGAETEFVSAREIAVQSAGQSPQRLCLGGSNSDFGFLNDADAKDLWLFGVRARAGAPNAWDIAKLPDSRERRRIVPDCRLLGEDVVAKRRYPDTVAQALSRQDPHGYLTDDFGYLAEISSEQVPGKAEKRSMYRVNLPLRCLLPKGVHGLAVVGLGAGIERDVVAITRMQADLMNMGYGVGLAAALAARNGGEFRTIDFVELRKRLVGKGILPKEALDWAKEDDVSSDALIAEAVRTLPDGYRGGHVLYRSENRARAVPLLRRAYADAKDAAAWQTYALALGLLGDATGAATLADCVAGRETPVKVRPGASGPNNKFSNAYSAGDLRFGMMLALGRTKSRLAVEPLQTELGKLDAKSPFDEFRRVMLALEASGDPSFAAPLARLLKAPGVGGHAVASACELKPLGGYGLVPEFYDCFRELNAARALLACGDCDGLARRTFEAYAKDPRGLLSAHAKAVLAPALPEKR